MPRSGTSLTTRALYTMGLDFGPENRLARGDRFNPSGYYENLDAINLNRWIIKELGGYNVIPPPRDAGPVQIERYVSACRRVLESAPNLKIPRAAFLLAVWGAAVPDARWIICIRTPWEVACSWRDTYGVGPREALDYWMRYTFRLLTIPPQARLLVNYDDWFRRPGWQARRLGDFAELNPTAEHLAQAASLPDPRLNHYTD